MDFGEKVLYQQIHPTKLAADVGGSIVSAYLMWHKRTKGIARELHVSERTVEPRLKEVREKLRVETNAQAVAQAMKNRFLRVDGV